uniref:Uncharacterized protein n=1 Tax=Trichinella nativa TaxID=6335 RepID=A0A0V1KJ94_9BILA
MFASARSAADLALFPRSPYSVNGISSGEHCREEQRSYFGKVV